MNGGVRLWHGGAPGRAIGDELLPPIRSGFKKTNSVLTGRPPKGHFAAYRPSLVYATTDRELAEVFAQLYSQDPGRAGYGVVYEVQLDDLVLDEDLTASGTCFQAVSGRIIGLGLPVLTSPTRLAEVLAAYQAQGDEVNRQRREEEREAKEAARAAKKAARKDR